MTLNSVPKSSDGRKMKNH